MEHYSLLTHLVYSSLRIAYPYPNSNPYPNPTLPRYNLVCNRAFLALWIVCWLVFARYRRVRSLHFAEEEEAGAGEHSGRRVT